MPPGAVTPKSPHEPPRAQRSAFPALRDACTLTGNNPSHLEERLSGNRHRPHEAIACNARVVLPAPFDEENADLPMSTVPKHFPTTPRAQLESTADLCSIVERARNHCAEFKCNALAMDRYRRCGRAGVGLGRHNTSTFRPT